MSDLSELELERRAEQIATALGKFDKLCAAIADVEYWYDGKLASAHFREAIKLIRKAQKDFVEGTK